MRNIISNISIAIICLLTASCSNTSSFKIEGSVEGNANTNLRFVYAGDDVLNNVVTAARDGKFTFEGRSNEPTMVQILDNEYNPIGFFYVENGDNLKIQISGQPPRLTAIEGSEVNDRLIKWLTDNAAVVNGKDPKRLNNAIKAYITAHTDDVVSTMLLVALYDASSNPAEARQLLEKINADARPSQIADGLSMGLERVSSAEATGKVQPIEYLSYADSMTTFKPSAHKRSLLVFNGETRSRADSLMTGLRNAKNDGVYVLEFTLTTDTFNWHASVRQDSTSWSHAWAPGGLGAPGISRLGISTLPYFIAVDASGRQLYRGPSLTAARRALGL